MKKLTDDVDVSLISKRINKDVNLTPYQVEEIIRSQFKHLHSVMYNISDKYNEREIPTVIIRYLGKFTKNTRAKKIRWCKEHLKKSNNENNSESNNKSLLNT